MIKAKLWSYLEDDDVIQCELCPHLCRLRDNGTGRCKVRFRDAGSLYSLSSGRISSHNIDPIEKKPLYHFNPGSQIFSIGSFGCNMSCSFCQNSSISQIIPRFESSNLISPMQVIIAAESSKTKLIAYTYNEPTVFYEFILETAKMAIDKSISNVLVSNGFMSEQCFNSLKGLVQAANFDLKSFSNDFYKKLCGASLKPVLNTMKRAVKAGWWVEITTLLIPGINDSDEEINNIAKFISLELGQDVPWHISRFHPSYKMQNIERTSVESVEKAVEAARRFGLHYVYAGNAVGSSLENTLCPNCGNLLIKRHGYDVNTFWKDVKGVCPKCEFKISGIW